MPELPEVETMVRDLRPRVTGRRITGVEAAFPGIVVYPSLEELTARLVGETITAVGRRGKYAIFTLSSGDVLVIHRGMTGTVLHRAAGAPEDRYVRIAFRLDDGTELRLDDPRKFGKVYLMDAEGTERPLPWSRMGPEPLEHTFSLAGFRAELARRTALIKPLLLNQGVVAGLGNIYVDEALHRARIHPTRRANTLTPAEVRRLHRAIGEVLADAVERRGTTFSTYADIEGRAGGFQDELRVFRRAEAPCPRCGTPITRTVVGGRGTHFCPRCQKA